MTEEQKICAKQILDKIVSGVYKCTIYFVVFAIIFCVFFFFLYPYYLKYDYISECKANGRAENWCEKTWAELEELD